MRRWTRTLPTVAAFAVSAAVFNRVPEVSTLDLSRLLPPAVPIGTGTVTRAAALFLMPVVSLAVLGLFTLLERASSSVQRFEATYNSMVFAVTGLLVLMHIVLVANVLGSPDWTYNLFTAVLGFGLIAAGNVMPRVRPNWIVGVRTRRTLSDPVAWAKTHRILGVLLLAVGSFVVLLSVIAPRYALIAGLVALLAAFVVSHALGTRSSVA
jgi:uncharacterized membrane protein